jgi:hypothetical protein
MTQSFDFHYDVPAGADVTIDLPPGHQLVDYDVTPIPAGAGAYGGAAAHDLATQLRAAGLSPDQIKGIQAMNEVEGGLFDPRSTLGFVSTGPQSQLGQGSAVQAFVNQQWNDPSRRGPGGSIPGVDKGGNVKDWPAYMTWIREKIVGQTGIKDWQGNQQPPAADYQNRLMSALPHFQHGGAVGDTAPPRSLRARRTRQAGHDDDGLVLNEPRVQTPSRHGGPGWSDQATTPWDMAPHEGPDYRVPT